MTANGIKAILSKGERIKIERKLAKLKQPNWRGFYSAFANAKGCLLSNLEQGDSSMAQY